MENGVNNELKAVTVEFSEVDLTTGTTTLISNISFDVTFVPENRPYFYGGSCNNDPHCVSIDGT